MVSSVSSGHISWSSPTSYVGPVQVRRPLPMAQMRSVGPFVLLDHFGPVPAPREKLPAHPHAGIEVMTYLLDGANEHTDSLGNIGQIGPGGAQWMKAGRGILHTERNLLDRATVMHGLQIWARLPIAQQDVEPAYFAYQAEDMVKWTQDGLDFRLIAGTMENMRGPIPLALTSVMAHLTLHGGTSSELTLPELSHEYAIYIIASSESIQVDKTEHLSAGEMLRLKPETKSVSLHNPSGEPVELFLLGGEPAPQPLVFGGSYVLDSQAALEKAHQRFQTGEMGTLDNVPF